MRSRKFCKAACVSYTNRWQSFHLGAPVSNPLRDDEAAADGGWPVLDPLKARVAEPAAYFRDRIASAFSDVHQQRGVLRDMERTGLVLVEECIVNHDEAT